MIIEKIDMLDGAGAIEVAIAEKDLGRLLKFLANANRALDELEAQKDEEVLK